MPPPKEVVVLEGSQTLIPCKAVGSPVPVINWYTTYYRGRWYRLRDNSKYTIHENGSLVIRNVNKQGTLKYKCVAYNLVARIGAETMVKVACKCLTVKIFQADLFYELIARWRLYWPKPTVTSIGLCSTSNVITLTKKRII